MAMWTIAFAQESFFLAQFLAILDAFVQCYALFAILGGSRKDDDSRADWLTTLIAKLSAVAGIIYMWQIRGIVDDYSSPSTWTFLHSAAAFVVLTLATGPNPTMGFCMLYVLASLFFGEHQTEGWHNAFLYMGMIVSVVMIVDNAVTRLALYLKSNKDQNSVAPLMEEKGAWL